MGINGEKNKAIVMYSVAIWWPDNILRIRRVKYNLQWNIGLMCY